RALARASQSYSTRIVWHCRVPLDRDQYVRLQRDQRLTLWYIGKRKQGFLRNHAIPQFTFLTPVGNRCITLCVCVKEPSRSRGVIPTAGGLYVHKGTVFCRNIRRHIQRYWILRRLCRSISCSAAPEQGQSVSKKEIT